MNTLKIENVDLPNYFKGIKEVEKQLDQTNITILSAMWKYGPRNLLEISRRTKLPFSSVYHRVRKLEAETGRIAYLVPETSKLGMVRVLVLVSARGGAETLLTKALKIPNLWRFINTCEGTFTHHSAHTVPVRFLKDFKKYVHQLSTLGLAAQVRIIPTGDYIPNLPNFKCYNPKLKRWMFPWEQWVTALKKNTAKKTIEDPTQYSLPPSRKDLLIVKELEKNARRTFVDLAPILGISLQGVKYHYDKILVPLGLVQYFDYDVCAFPVEISAYHEVMLEFIDSQAMNRFFSFMDELPFIVGVAKVLRHNTLLTRTYIPESQLAKMFAFFSELAKGGILQSYSSVRLSYTGRETQTISYELFNDENGWMFNFEKCLSELQALTIRRTVSTSLEPHKPFTV